MGEELKRKFCRYKVQIFEKQEMPGLTLEEKAIPGILIITA